MTSPLHNLPPQEMLRAIHTQVSQIAARTEEQAKLGARVEATLLAHTNRFLELNKALGEVGGKVVRLDVRMAQLEGRVDSLHADRAEHAERLEELERTRYQRPTPRVSLVDAAERVTQSIAPGKTTKADLGTELETGSFKVRPEVLDKLLAERDAAKIVAESLEEKANRKKRLEAVRTAVTIVLALAVIGLVFRVLISQAQRTPPEFIPPEHAGH